MASAFLHKHLSFVCIKTGDNFTIFLVGERKAHGKILVKQLSVCTVNSFLSNLRNSFSVTRPMWFNM